MLMEFVNWITGYGKPFPDWLTKELVLEYAYPFIVAIIFVTVLQAINYTILWLYEKYDIDEPED